MRPLRGQRFPLAHEHGNRRGETDAVDALEVEQAAEEHSQLVGRARLLRREPPVIHELLAPVETERRLGIADVDSEQHRASESDRRRRSSSHAVRACYCRLTVFSRRSRDLAGPVIGVTIAGVVAGAVAAGIVARRRRRAKGAPMENAKLIVKRLFEEPWHGNFGVIDEFVSPDYVGHDPAEPEPIRWPGGCAGERREVHRRLPRRSDHRRRADRGRRPRGHPLDGSRDARRRARRHRPNGEGRHRRRPDDFALRGREDRRGMDDLGHLRDARPTRRDPRTGQSVRANTALRKAVSRPL